LASLYTVIFFSINISRIVIGTAPPFIQNYNGQPLYYQPRPYFSSKAAAGDCPQHKQLPDIPSGPPFIRWANAKKAPSG
ncbi:MAG: hypothetical protein IKI23_10610, partial [Lachnospiraceae bacterium]|nr:hypothetical protein [Lachnospiraceae bacterium]